ncbi:MAG: hypothetical protein ABIN18_23145 [Pseudomonadota bacterium]
MAEEKNEKIEEGKRNDQDKDLAYQNNERKFEYREETRKEHNEIIKESLDLTKELQKLILGLATATLVFSVTFVDKLAPELFQKWILVTGWASLLISILAGVAFISVLLRQHIFIRQLPLETYTLDVLRNFKNQFKEAIKKHLIFTNELSLDENKAEKMAELFSQKEVWEFFSKKGKFKSHVSTKDVKALRRIAGIMAILVSLVDKIYEEKGDGDPLFPTKMAKKLISQLTIWNKVAAIVGYVSQAAFFVGIVLIALFAFLNL